MKFVCKGLILLLSIATVFGGDKDEEPFRPGGPETFPHHQTISSLTIAADAFSTRAETEKAFGKKLDPAKYGILPILILVENNSSKALRLDRMKVEYIRPDRRRLEPLPPEDVRFLSGIKKPNTPGVKLPIPSIPGIGGNGKKNPLESQQVQGWSFAAQMLPPGESAYGFIYFNSAYWKESVIYITGIYEAATGQELFYFEIPLE
jgi:hypothetical protein